MHRLAPLFFLLALVPTARSAEPNPEPTHRFHEMAPGVHFATGTGVVSLVSNALVIVNEDHVVVVDSHVSPDAGRALAGAVARQISDKPIRYLVNTHFHFDHAHGNAGFPAETRVIGHERTFERLSGDVTAEPVFRLFGTAEAADRAVTRAEHALAEASADERPARARQLAMDRRHAEAVRQLAIRAPDLSFDRRLTLREGGREIRLLFLGRGHTGGDVIVYLPAEKLVFTGDLLQPGAPFMGDGYPDEWVLTLQAMEALDFEWVLPGHGEPFTDRAEIDRFKRFLRDFTAEVRQLRAQGLAPAQAAARLKLDGWHDYAAWMLDLPRLMELQVRRIYELDAR